MDANIPNLQLRKKLNDMQLIKKGVPLDSGTPLKNNTLITRFLSDE